MPVLSLTSSPVDTPMPLAPVNSASIWDARSPARAGTASLDLALITSKAGFEALQDDWNDLFQRSGGSQQLFQTFDWLWHWAQNFLSSDAKAGVSLAIVTGRRDGRLSVVCPFVRVEKRGLTCLSFMGDPVSQYGDVLADRSKETQADLRLALRFALSATGADALHLRKVRADAVIAPLLAELGCTETDAQVAPYIDFEGVTDYARFEQRYSSGARRNRRRQLRRLEDRGPTSFERLAPGPEARDAVSLAISMKRGWLKERGLVSAALADPRTEAFFRDCAMGGAHAAGLGVGLVRCNGEVAAIELTVSAKDRTAIHVIAYNLKFEKTGAGSLLMEDSIRRACGEGRGTFDLLAPGGAYKFDWADRSIAVKDYAKGLSLSGKLYTAIMLKRLRPAAKYLVEHCPILVRRQLSSLAGIFAVAGV